MPTGKAVWSLFSALRGKRSGAARQGARKLREARARKQILGQQPQEPPWLGSSSSPSSWDEERHRFAQLVPTWNQTCQARVPRLVSAGGGMGTAAACRKISNNGHSHVTVGPVTYSTGIRISSLNLHSKLI